jgi:hypothetical protein
MFVEYPALAFVMAAGCAGLWLWRRGRGSGVAAVSWILYAVYELLMKVRVLCSGECNIRVDLLAIYPFLIAVSAATLITSARALLAARPERG